MPVDNGAAPAGAGAGGAGDGQGGANPPEGYIPKEQYEKEKGELQQQLEDLKLEIVTPEYIAFLEGKRAPAPAPKAESEKVDFSKMTPDQIYAKAVADSKAATQAEIDRVRTEFTSSSKESIKKEIDAFARSTPDFEKYRPLMRGLSDLPKNKDLTLQELYNLAKEHAKGFGPTEDEKGKSRRAGGERPGGSSPSVVKDKKYTASEASEEAWEEVVGKEGFPAA